MLRARPVAASAITWQKGVRKRLSRASDASMIWSYRMAAVALVAATAMTACNREAKQTAAQQAAADTAALRQQLTELGRIDQEVRRGITPASSNDSAFTARMQRADSANTARLKDIVARHGWPGKSLVGAAAARAAFLIVQHTDDHEFQKRMLPLLESAAARGDVPGQDLAMLTDRVLMHDGKPQKYGTQGTIRDGKMLIHPIEDAPNVDARRARLGMPPLAEYKKLLAETYHMQVIDTPDSARMR